MRSPTARPPSSMRRRRSSAMRRYTGLLSPTPGSPLPGSPVWTHRLGTQALSVYLGQMEADAASIRADSFYMRVAPHIPYRGGYFAATAGSRGQVGLVMAV